MAARCSAKLITNMECPYLSAVQYGDFEAFTCFHTATCAAYSGENACECMSDAFEGNEDEAAPAFVARECLQILEYVRDNCSDHMWTTLLSFCLEEACGAEKFGLAQWCFEQGAQWLCCLIDDDPDVRLCASAATVAWAVSHGCNWGDWNSAICQQFMSEDQEAIVQWAHSNGCPCACIR
jgi:hypothetical protein